MEHVIGGDMAKESGGKCLFHDRHVEDDDKRFETLQTDVKELVRVVTDLRISMFRLLLIGTIGGGIVGTIFGTLLTLTLQKMAN